MSAASQPGFGANLVSCFTYPFNLRLGALIVGAAALIAIVSLFPLGTSIGYWFILLVVSRLGFDIADRFAAGHVRPADAPKDFPSGGFARPLKYWLILLGMSALIERYGRKYGYAAATGMDIVTSLILPGMTIVLAMTGSIKAALNPAEWWRVAHVAPGAFVVLALVSLGIDQMGYFAGEWLFPDGDDDDESDTPLGPLALYAALVVYLRLVSFCLVGLYIHSHREALGVPEDGEVVEAPAGKRVAAEADLLGARVRADIAKGNLDEAEKAAYDAMRDDPYDAARHGLYHQALMARPDKTKAIAHARRYLSLLIKGGNTPEALKIFKRLAAVDPTFKPEQPEEVLPFAKAARELKDPHAAVAIVRGFDKANTGHPDIPGVYLFTARMLAEDMNNTDMARKILQHMLARYPGHSLAGEAKGYLQSIPAPT